MNQHIIRRIACVLILAILACAIPFSASAEGNVVITLDPGHGGVDGGAVATHNGVEYIEKDLVYKIASYCKEYLETHYLGVTVFMTRTEDEGPELDERVDYAVSVGSDFLLSIHLNIFADGTARGAAALVPAGTYNPGQAEISQDVATLMLSKLEDLGLRNRGHYSNSLKLTTYPNGGGADSYYLLRYAVPENLPCFIMEECFMDDSEDFQNVLASEEKLQKLGEVNAQALAEYFQLEENPNAGGSVVVDPTESEPEPSETTEEPVPETTAPNAGDGKKSSGLGAVLKVIGIVVLVWFLIKCYQFHQFRKRQEEKRRRAKARAAARRRAQQAKQVNPDGTYPLNQRDIPRSEYEVRSNQTPQRRYDPAGRHDHYNHLR